MSVKKVGISAKPKRNESQEVDDWVRNRQGKEQEIKEKEEKKPVSKESIKRLTIDIPESLHRKIKATCAGNGSTIADEIRSLLLQKYGNVEM